MLGAGQMPTGQFGGSLGGQMGGPGPMGGMGGMPGMPGMPGMGGMHGVPGMQGMPQLIPPQQEQLPFDFQPPAPRLKLIRPVIRPGMVSGPPGAAMGQMPFYPPAVPVMSVNLVPQLSPEELQAREEAARLEAEKKAKEEAEAAEKARKEEERRSIEKGEGYFKPFIGYRIGEGDSGPYTVVANKPLGVGMFSSVWAVADKNNKLIAVKAARSQEHFQKVTKNEVALLDRLKSLRDVDPEGCDQLMMLREHFMHGQHLMMTFEKLEGNLRSAGKQPLDKAISYAKQILCSLRFLHDTAGVVHCDVKPDNLLMRWDGLAVKLADFGAARTPDLLQVTDDLQPLYYRAPEVLIGATRGRKIDLWSAGCTIYEMIVGRIWMQSCTTLREVMEHVMKNRGPPTKWMRDEGRLTRLYFSHLGFHPENGTSPGGDPIAIDSYKKRPMIKELQPHVDFGDGPKGSLAQAQARAQLSKLIGSITVVAAANRKRKRDEPSEKEKKLEQLAALLELLMEVDPNERVTATTALCLSVFDSVEMPPWVELQDAPPLPADEGPALPPTEPPPPQ
eukprot:TRINITY_DN80364_c0_g1_i1.p1 TRINITY_DN80364_c0_g1~~TRINITY_DN80364_c0_g1_i1.p1  ORF type:complete len:561 (-),score=105.77 TRINITY_DN80364_c0_g1_i1:54-1736(-)